MNFISVSIILFFVSVFGKVQGWGSSTKFLRPKDKFSDSFSKAFKVKVQPGQSYQDAEWFCNNKVGKSNPCHIHLLGVPSELNQSNSEDYSGLYIGRSRTKLSAADNVTLTRYGNGAFVSIVKNNVQNIVIENLRMKGQTEKANFIAGVRIYGSNIRNIAIRHSEFYDFNAKDAHAIAVFGPGRKAVKNIFIEWNYIHGLDTGSSESISVNGFVRKFLIALNTIKNVNNIAIDVIGGEGVYPVNNGHRILPSSKDAARYGTIEYNTVSGMSTQTNAAYGFKRSWASAIYVDGGKNILVQGNTVENSPWGLDIGAENCVDATNVMMRWNKVSGSFFGDLVVGGYRRSGFRVNKTVNCNPKTSIDDGEGHGYVKRITIYGNELLSKNVTVSSSFALFRTTYAIIVQENIELADGGFAPVNADSSGSAEGDENAIRTSF